MSGKPLFNFRLGEKRRAKWESYLEDHNQYETVAGLIRGAVSAEIGRHENAEPEAQSSTSTDELEQVREDIERIKMDVRWLRTHQQGAADISSLSNEVRDDLIELPRISLDVPQDVEDEETYRYQARAAAALTPSAGNEEPPSYTIDAIEERLDADPDDVREAINHLKDQFIPIKEVEIEGETHYFLEGQ